MKYPLATTTWDDKEKKAAHEVIESGMCTMGEKVVRFEEKFASFVGSKHAVMVNSGSSANLLMVAALFYRKQNQLSPGDEVIVPAVSWPTTYYPLYQYGLKLKFVDIDRHTLNYNLLALERAVTNKTKLIMAVNLLGNPNDFDQIAKITKERNIIVIEDNCESLGAVYKGKQAGTFGLMGTYSTFFSHHMSTMEGGVIVTDDIELYHILLCLRAHGWTRNLPKKNMVSGVKSDDPFEESFKFVLPGYNVRPLEIEAAIGLEQLDKLSGFIDFRRKNAIVFQEYFKGNPFFDIQAEIGSSSWFGFSIIIKEAASITRKELASALITADIECRPIVAGNFSKNPVMAFIPHEISGSLKNAEHIDKYGLFVGNHQYDLTHELSYLRDVLGKSF